MPNLQAECPSIGCCVVHHVGDLLPLATSIIPIMRTFLHHCVAVLHPRALTSTFPLLRITVASVGTWMCNFAAARLSRRLSASSTPLFFPLFADRVLVLGSTATRCISRNTCEGRHQRTRRTNAALRRRSSSKHTDEIRHGKNVQRQAKMDVRLESKAALTSEFRDRFECCNRHREGDEGSGRISMVVAGGGLSIVRNMNATSSCQ